MDLGYIAPCPVCGGKIKLYSHCGKPDCKAVCQSCKKGFPFHANLKTYAGTKIYASSIRKSVRMWLFRRENVIVTPIASIYESMSDMITDICDENKWGRAKGEEFIQREYANHYQFIDSIGLIVYELDA